MFGSSLPKSSLGLASFKCLSERACVLGVRLAPMTCPVSDRYWRNCSSVCPGRFEAGREAMSGQCAARGKHLIKSACTVVTWSASEALARASGYNAASASEALARASGYNSTTMLHGHIDRGPAFLIRCGQRPLEQMLYRVRCHCLSSLEAR